MDVCESQRAPKKQAAVDTPRRQPLVSAEKNNAVTTGRPRTREVSSRYRSPTPSKSPGVRRCPSPNFTRTASASSQLAPKRAQSVERKRPSTPPSPPSPSTPVQDSSVNTQLPSRRTTGGRFPEGLWPSTMRSLSVSFQSDIISIPISKKEKPVSNASSDRTLRPSSNVAHKQVETPTVPRKPTPERRRSPLKGKNASDQSENSRPFDTLPARLIDQHRWPSRMGGKVSSNTLTKSVDLSDNASKTFTMPGSGIGLSSLRRLSLDGTSKPLQKFSSDAVRLMSLDGSSRSRCETSTVDDNTLRESEVQKILSVGSLDRIMLTNPAVRSQSLPAPGSRPPSPSKSSVPSSFSRGVSPSRTRPSTPPSRGISPSRTRPSTPPSRGVSPSRIRASNPPSQSNSSTSVLSFIADFRKGKKGASYIEDAHQLRLLYNRYLQWRFANARAETVQYIQKLTAERTLYNVWTTTLALWDTVIRKRISLQQLKLEIKLSSILSAQMPCLDGWAMLEGDHISSLSGALEDLEASTLRLPVTGGARADIETLKTAVCSAVDIMQAMGSSICALLSRVEATHQLVSELANIAAQERAMLDGCENLLASTAAMQVEEYSLRTHLIQMKQALEKEKHPILAIKTPP